ncbi:NADPH-dependent FMN reductase [Cytobacillus purgationiresistens]|uniref:NAD(P)H-dependent FMN reductase n=1 Tax=Cytobacillus purgationiresistens TaxID=863449 RepID=A0ABU0AEE2_9BACI|nr:NAD(P)H-dependent oxidoreductase [Cytobacillus purgationiresistens]MDQ0269621.1 NAD(P)H-dependent FMN reductase [Cytobacillus purgationiresistens]
MKIAAFVGSNRKDSLNKKLTLFMQERYQEKVEIDILPLEKLPMYNQDNELDPPEIVKEIRTKILESDGLLFATPEYNHSIPAFLKNALDWFSRIEKVMLNKPAMIVGVSAGVLGTAKAQMHLRQILNSGGIGAVTLPGNEVFIGSALDKFNESGTFTHEQTIDFLDQVVENYIGWVNKVK